MCERDLVWLRRYFFLFRLNSGNFRLNSGEKLPVFPLNFNIVSPVFRKLSGEFAWILLTIDFLLTSGEFRRKSGRFRQSVIWRCCECHRKKCKNHMKAVFSVMTKTVGQSQTGLLRLNSLQKAMVSHRDERENDDIGSDWARGQTVKTCGSCYNWAVLRSLSLFTKTK